MVHTDKDVALIEWPSTGVTLLITFNLNDLRLRNFKSFDQAQYIKRELYFTIYFIRYYQSWQENEIYPINKRFVQSNNRTRITRYINANT